MTLDELLAAHGWSARQVERAGGPPMGTLRRWRRGVTPQRPTLRRLADVTGLPLPLLADAAAETLARARAAEHAP